jgi:hypothetical protein
MSAFRFLPLVLMLPGYPEDAVISSTGDTRDTDTFVFFVATPGGLALDNGRLLLLLFLLLAARGSFSLVSEEL